jgi:stage II sporulation protein B
MDKPKGNRTITIKINGHERCYKENFQKDGIQPQAQVIQSRHATELDGISEIAASQQALDESFDWILPDEQDDDEIEEYTIVKKPVDKKNSVSTLRNSLQKKHTTGPIKSLLFSILLAIIIGTTFGFLVLKLVISDAKLEVNQVTTVPQESSTPQKENTIVTNQPLLLQPIRTFIVQGGVFSSMDSAKLEEEKVKQKGVPTRVIETNGQAILLLGLADSIEKAKAIGSDMKEKGIEVFAKSYVIPEKDLNELTSVEAKLLKEIEPVYQALASLASSGMLGESINEIELQEQKDFLLSIDKQEIQSGKVEQLRVELAGAIEKIAAYNQQKSQTLIVEAQKQLLTFLGIYLSL